MNCNGSLMLASWFFGCMCSLPTISLSKHLCTLCEGLPGQLLSFGGIALGGFPPILHTLL
jgi:hypothetical protein